MTNDQSLSLFNSCEVRWMSIYSGKAQTRCSEIIKNIGILLSSYTRAINKQQQRKGKLFAHNSTAKCLNDTIQNDNLLENCFHYIHQNPLRAGLCNKLKDWEFCSFRDYAGYRNGTLINKELAFEIINYDFENQSNIIVDERKLKGIF